MVTYELYSTGPGTVLHSTSLRTSIAWIMTLLPSFLYAIMEIYVWRTKRTWTSTTATAAAAIVDEENPIATLTVEEVNSPVHEPNTTATNTATTTNTTTITTPPSPAETSDTEKKAEDVVVEMKEIKAKKPQRKPMIKTPSSKPSAPVSELLKRYNKEKTQQL